MFQQILRACKFRNVVLADTVNLLTEHSFQPLLSMHFYHRNQMLESIELSLQIDLKFHLSNSYTECLESSRNRTLQGRSLTKISYFCYFLWQLYQWPHLPPFPSPPFYPAAISVVLVPISWLEGHQEAVCEYFAAAYHNRRSIALELSIAPSVFHFSTRLPGSGRSSMLLWWQPPDLSLPRSSRGGQNLGSTELHCDCGHLS